MRKLGSVTVFFSLVFMIVFSFILSFFEMAAYTARASYHASAALLATENYFAAYFEPLFDQYHIFGREVPEGEDIISWTENSIAGDVSYMTRKREGENSLLLRSGAEYEVTDASVLTDDKLEGFYTQAVTAMKYQGVAEAANILKEFAGMTEEANAHLEIAEAKAATDTAYAKVDEKVLKLIEMVDGVDIAKYEKFMGGKRVLFQKEIYVKHFCVDASKAANYFDRAEVYQSFLDDYENPYMLLDSMSEKAYSLADEMEERELREEECRIRLEEIEELYVAISEELSGLKEKIEEASEGLSVMSKAIDRMRSEGGDPEAIAILAKQIGSLRETLDSLEEQKEACAEKEEALGKEEKALKKEQKELKEKKKDQEQQAKSLMRQEEAFIEKCREIRDICDEAYDYVEEVREELERAKKVKSTCESVLDALSPIIGEEATEEYRAELDEYLFYEGPEGFDFEAIKQRLLENKSCLWNISKKINGIDKGSLRAGAGGLSGEKVSVSKYSFEGLKLSYGEMSLAEDLYDGVESMISDKLASGFLGFLTEKEVSEKAIDTAYLPSGFRNSEDEFDIFSLLGTDMSDIFGELQTLLPQDIAGAMVNEATDTVLFHSYLATHFQSFLEEDGRGALSYEQEYLIAGKETDKENLSSVALRICAIRTILHFISLYTDSTRKAPVEQAALAACGIIGLPALKSIVVFLLLFVWALEEAMIDTAAYLLGKRLLLYPGKKGGSLSFPEILKFSKTFVLEKAKKKEEVKGLVFGYNEFLHLFLFLTPKEDKKYRAADLIQENLRTTHHSSFRLNRCVWEISYQTDRKTYEYAYEQ